MTDNAPHLITDLDTIKARAAQRQDEFEVMRYMLEFREDIPDTQIDAIVDAIATPIIDAIDCTQCGNCCRSLDVYLTPQDAQRLADGIHISLDELDSQYLEHDIANKVGEWGRFQATPCAFLHGSRCSVYPYRPDTCRDYPFFTPDFRWMLTDIIDGAGICPIIYNVLDAMVKRVETL